MFRRCISYVGWCHCFQHTPGCSSVELEDCNLPIFSTIQARPCLEFNIIGFLRFCDFFDWLFRRIAGVCRQHLAAFRQHLSSISGEFQAHVGRISATFCWSSGEVCASFGRMLGEIQASFGWFFCEFWANFARYSSEFRLEFVWSSPESL